MVVSLVLLQPLLPPSIRHLHAPFSRPTLTVNPQVSCSLVLASNVQTRISATAAEPCFHRSGTSIRPMSAFQPLDNPDYFARRQRLGSLCAATTFAQRLDCQIHPFHPSDSLTFKEPRSS